jgi:hypothetical protein
MAENATATLQLLEDLRRERDELSLVIRTLEKRLGIVVAETASTTDSQAGAPGSPRVTVTLDNIPVGFFHNLSQAAATEKLLRMNPGHPLSTSEILDAFRKSGMTVNPKNASTILYTALTRSSKFERVASKAWGLAEWYPESRKRLQTKSDHTEEVTEADTESHPTN